MADASIYTKYSDQAFLKLLGTRPNIVERELADRLRKALDEKAATAEKLAQHDDLIKEIEILRDQLDHMTINLQSLQSGYSAGGSS